MKFSIVPPVGADFLVEHSKAVPVMVPANLNLSLLVHHYKPQFSTYKDEPWRHIDKLAYLVSLLSYLPAVNKKLDLDETDGYVPLQSELLRQFLGKNYLQYIDFLIECGVLEVDEAYKAGEYSKGFRLTQQYRFSELKVYPIRLASLNKKIEDHRFELHDDEYERTHDLLDQKTWQQQDFVQNAVKLKEISGEVSIDVSKAEQYILPLASIPKPPDACKRRKKKKRKKKGVASKRRRLTKKQKIKAKEYTVLDKVNAYWVNVKMISGKNSGYAFQNRQSGRFFTPVVSLKSELRAFLSIGGQSDLREVDLKNSQPMLLASLLREWDDVHPMVKETLKWVNPMAYKRVEENCKKNLEEIEQEETQEYQWESKDKKMEKAERRSLLMLCKKELFDEQNEPIWDIINVHDEFATFLSLVLTGYIYEFIIDLSDVFGLEPITRPEAKCMFLRMMYGQTKYLSSLPLYQVFERIFPNLCKLFALIKEDNHIDFPIFLQLLEARVFLGKALTKIWQESPDVKLQTIHDSYLVPKEQTEMAKKHLSEVVEEVVGLKPSIRVSDPKDKLIKLNEELEEMNFEPVQLIENEENEVPDLEANIVAAEGFSNERKVSSNIWYLEDGSTVELLE